MKKSQKPILLLGGGATSSEKEVKKLVSKLNIPVISTLMGIGTYPSNEKLYLGMIGMNGTYSANMAINNADFVLALGVSFSDRSTCRKNNFAQDLKIVSVNTNHISQGFAQEIISNSSQFINAFIKYIDGKELVNTQEWIKKTQLYKEETISKPSNSDCLHSSYVLETIYEKTKNLNPVVVTDVGQHQLLTAQFFNFNQPNKFITSGGLGTMGFGLPASIGVYIANPQNMVLNITGDGSFQMNLQELATCREHNIPVKIIIMNNSYLGMVRQMQKRIYDKFKEDQLSDGTKQIVKRLEMKDIKDIKAIKEYIRGQGDML